MKTDWGFVVELLCIGLLGVAILYMGQYIDTQAKRIDRLELEINSLVDQKQKPVGGVNWHDKEE